MVQLRDRSQRASCPGGERGALLGGHLAGLGGQRGGGSAAGQARAVAGTPRATSPDSGGATSSGRRRTRRGSIARVTCVKKVTRPLTQVF